MEHVLDLTGMKRKERFPLSERFAGQDEAGGRELSFTNGCMLMNGAPFLGISGECHYARVHERQWEDTILKMKMGGINTVATYVFWIHHEEQEGVFRFDGNRNVRRFLQLCQKHAMHVIVRIGPFAHGEARNGGLPDWLYGKPFEVRAANEGFLACTRRFFMKLAEQLEGLYFQDGGPIIAAQIENEYMHSAAPWEMTTGVTNEWVPAGSEGNAYMLALKRIAQEAGIVTPFYTCTAWGGAATPAEEMLPVWGGYAFWPWMFHDYRGPHPATPEYIYRDYHNRDVPKTYNFEPAYDPESLPYVCCEMGGGMACFYRYRFQLPYESVDAMANVKLASGCNFLGYFMYRGGSNPRGATTPFLNECQCPKISYDYQAPIGEFGQLRPSYYRLKALHQLARSHQALLCGLDTALPEGAEAIAPEDVTTLRYAARTDGRQGFLFLNNYQDHVCCTEKRDETIRIRTQEGEVVIPGISLAAGEEAVLPFGLDVAGYRLVYAKAQPLSVIRDECGAVCFFFCPAGMEPEYVWDSAGLRSVCGKRADAPTVTVRPEAGRMTSYMLEGERGAVRIVTLTRAQSLMFYEVECSGRKHAVLCDGPLLVDGDRLLVESPGGDRTQTLLMAYPGLPLRADAGVRTEAVGEGIFSGLRLHWDAAALATESLAVRKTGAGRYVVSLPPETDGCKDRLLQIRCRGDVGHAFADGVLIADHFCNGAVWEIGLKEALPSEDVRELTILITPEKAEVTVNVSSVMAGRTEQTAGAVEALEEVRLQPVREAVVRMG